MHYECDLCLEPRDEKFCPCGGMVRPVTDSRRVPGVRSAAELERVQRIYGAQAAAQLAMDDALTKLRASDEQRQMDSLREAAHYQLAREMKW